MGHNIWGRRRAPLTAVKIPASGASIASAANATSRTSACAPRQAEAPKVITPLSPSASATASMSNRADAVTTTVENLNRHPGARPLDTVVTAPSSWPRLFARASSSITATSRSTAAASLSRAISSRLAVWVERQGCPRNISSMSGIQSSLPTRLYPYFLEVDHLPKDGEVRHGCRASYDGLRGVRWSRSIVSNSIRLIAAHAENRVPRFCRGLFVSRTRRFERPAMLS